MAIVAHPDDDLYFFNPLLASQIRASARHVTVCVTCGESDGKNMTPDAPGYASLPADFERYAAARLNGVRSAYAQMVVGDRNAEWRREALTLVDDIDAELSTLIAAPHVGLVALNLRESPPVGSADGAGNLSGLWTGVAAFNPTMVVSDSPVSQARSYAREGLIEALVALLVRCDPTLVWTMDPDPDYQIHDKDHPRFADSGDYSDHEAHTAVALFSHEALQRWFANGAGTATAVEGFRGYYVRRWPSNLSPHARAVKQRFKDIYGWADGRRCAYPAGCGDLKVGGSSIGRGNASGTTLRYPGSRSWADMGRDGRLSAFAVLGGQLVHWREVGDGRFIQAGRLAVHRLVPHVSAVALPDGGWRLFSVEQRLAADPAAQYRALVTAVLREPYDYVRVRWESIGSPHLDDGGARLRCIGMPLAISLSGAVLVLVRNFRKGLCARLYDDGSWTPWLDFDGENTQDGLAAVAVGDDSVEVLAAGREGVARWLISLGSRTAKFSVVPVEPPAGPPAIVQLPNGDRMMMFRRQDSASIVCYRTTSGGGEWDYTSATDLGGRGGPGPVTARFIPDADAVLVAVRNDDSATSVTWIEPNGESVGEWLHSSTPVVHSHAVCPDSRGVPVVMAVSTTGRLNTAHLGRSARSLEPMREVA